MGEWETSGEKSKKPSFCLKKVVSQVPQTAMACIRTWCQKLCGRSLTPGRLLTVEIAEEVRQQYEELLPSLLEALESDECSEVSARIHFHLEKIKAQLKEIAEKGETSVECRVRVNIAWETRTLIFGAKGFAFVESTSPSSHPLLTPWTAVSSLGDPPAGASLIRRREGLWFRRRWRRNRPCLQMEIERSNESQTSIHCSPLIYSIEANQNPITYTLEFDTEDTPEMMKAYWEESRDIFLKGPSKEVLPLRELLRDHRKIDEFEMHHVYQAELPLELAEVTEQLSSNEESNPLYRMHLATKAEDVKCWPWVEDGADGTGQMRCFEYKQILEPSLGPSDTRVSVVYHLQVQNDSVILHKATKCWDIPFKDDFQVYHKHIFTAQGDKVLLQIEVGFKWGKSPLLYGVKSIIRSKTQEETAKGGDIFSSLLTGRDATDEPSR